MDDLDKLLGLEEPDIDDIVKEVMATEKKMVKDEVKQKMEAYHSVSANDIIPDEYQQKLMQLDITMTRCFWLIGDITEDIINSVNRERVKLLEKVVTQNDIFEAVGYFCHRTARTIRYYYEIAHYFPIEIREKYDVPFIIYAEARWAKNWELMLQIAEANPMWSAARVKEEYYKQVDEPRSDDTNELTDDGVEEPKDEPLGSLLGRLEYIVNILRKLISKPGVNPAIVARAEGVIEEIGGLIEDVRLTQN